MNVFTNFLKIMLFFLLLNTNLSAAEEEFLTPEKAFALSSVKVVQDPAGDKLLVRWEIADGYYMYKKKISFYSKDKSITVGEHQLPNGIIKQDDFFGEVEVFKHELVATVPVSSSVYGKELTIIAKSQGCAAAGLCYPPFRQDVNFTLTKASTTSTTASTPESLSTASSKKDILPADEAFKLQLENNSKGELIAIWEIAPGYHLYQDKIKFETIPVIDKALANIDFPEAKKITEKEDKERNVYEGNLAITVPLQEAVKNAKNLQLKVSYQGCTEGFCYTVLHKTFNIDPSSLALSPGKAMVVEESAKQATTTDDEADSMSEQDQLANTIASNGLFMVMLTFFGIGLLLAFTPCVFPMIPILSGIIAGQGDDITTRKAFIMSTLYVLAMAVTYTIVGVFAGMSGENVQIWFQNPWVLTAFAGIFVLLALSMFGFYEIQLPSSIQSKITSISNSQEGGSYSGVIIMGLLSALIVGPCVAPPLMGALIYISQTGDPYLGGGALFALSMGMGVPLIAIGTSAGKFMPRAGGWMDSVKVFFGIMMLAIGIWMLERVVSPIAAMWLWALLFVFSAVYLGALTPITEETTGWGRFRKAAGIVILTYGIILILGASMGNEDMFEPLKNNQTQMVSSGGANATTGNADFKKVMSMAELDSALASAKESGKVAMLDFYADWCIACKELEKFTFSDPAVISLLNKFQLIQADVTEDNDNSQALMKSNKVIGPPAILFFDTNGDEVKRFRLVGYKNPEEFKAHLEKFLATIK